MTQWHYSLNGQPLGPVLADEIRRLLTAGTLNGNSLVWREGLESWVPLAVVMPEFQAAPAPVIGQDAPDNVVPFNAAPVPAISGAPTSFGQQEQTHPFEFGGRTGEYFRIWIVNVVLSVLTLGIYGAWAKVRTRRYFYGNTLLDGKPFEFTGNPFAILKGNLIFGGLFILYVISGAIFPPLALVIILFVLCIAPWLITKALRFRAHNTMHRNVRFHFAGTTGESYRVYVGLALLFPFTLGLIAPYMQYRQKKYFLGNMGWGNLDATMRGGAGFYYKTFFKIVGLFLLLGIIAGSLAPLLFSQIENDRRQQESKLHTPGPSAQSRAQRPVEGNGTKIQGRKNYPPIPSGAASVTMFIFGGAFYVVAFAVGIYYRVRLNNFALNSTEWGSLGRLKSSVRARDLMWIYFTNGLAALVSLGLAIPWIKIRMARYMAAHTVFVATGSLDAVAQTYSKAESAMGDAGADIFDFDIGF